MAASNGSNNSDNNSDMEDELSPELSAQLGDLILGAHQFNVDNPNVGINFMQVFGGDEDFGFNPGDDEMMDLYDSDGDSYLDEVEDSVQQIFTSLGDSHVIRRLSYHKGASASGTSFLVSSMGFSIATRRFTGTSFFWQIDVALYGS